MKSLRFALSIFMALALSLSVASNCAFAEDELPPPQDTVGGAEPSPGSPPPQEIPTSDEDSLPNLGGQEDLPAPSLGDGKDDPANQVNKGVADEDNIFLPTPAAQDDANFSAPMDPAYTNYNNSGNNYESADWRSGMHGRPVFSLYGGVARRGFASANIGESSTRTGPNVGFSVRLFDLGQTVFVHAYADYMNFKVGDVITTSGVSALSGVNVSSFHYGPILEIGVGRRVSIFGTLLHQNDMLTADPIPSTDVRPPAAFYENIAEETRWKPGLGIQYDFYVIPHGSMGVRAHFEENTFTVTLSVSMEPIPKKRLTL